MPITNDSIALSLTRTGNPSAHQHFAATPLDVVISFATEDDGNVFDGATEFRLELHRDRLITGMAPLAYESVPTPTGTTQSVSFTAAQMNQNLGLEARKVFWLVAYCIYPEDVIRVFQIGSLTLLAHPAAAFIPAAPDASEVTFPLTGPDDPRGRVGATCYDPDTGYLYRKLSIDPHLWVGYTTFTPATEP